MEECIYKYIGEKNPEKFIEIITSILKDKTLKVTNPKDFNDPFDCNIPHIEEKELSDEIKKLLITKFKEEIINENPKKKIKNFEKVKKELTKNKEFENEIEKFNEEIRISIDELHNLWDDAISEFRVISFSSSYENILMWSHYTHYHQGIVLGFKKLENSIFKDVKKVNYDYRLQSKKFILNNFIKKVIELENNQKKMDEESEKMFSFLFDYFFIKKEEWKYEDEYRVVFFKDDKRISQYQENVEIVNFEQEILSEIIFGYKMDNTQKKEIIKIIKNCNYNSELSIYEMIKKNGKLERKHYNIR